MKTRRCTAVKAWYLWFLILFIILSVTPGLLAQESSSETSSEQQGLNAWKDKLAGLVQKYPLIAVVVFIVVIVLALLKDVIKKVIKDRLNPLVGKLITWLLIRFGRYSSLLKKYQQTLQRSLKEGGLTRKLIGEWVDLETNYIQIQLSREEYKNPETVPTIGSANETQAGSKPPRVTETSGDDRIDVGEVLADEKKHGNRLAIIGDPGSGKTTLLSYLAYEYTKGRGVRPVPVLITLTLYVKSEFNSIPLYLEYVFAENAFPKAAAYLESLLKAGRLLILLDGFDEVEMDKREGLKRQIEAFANHQEYLQNKFVVTSRPIQDAFFDRFRHLEVMPLLPEQRKAFLESKIDNSPKSDFDADRCAYLVEAIEGHERIRKLAENPLLLTFLYHVYKYNMELPRRRVELYNQSVNLMLDWDMKTNRPTHIRVKERDPKREVLKKVAYYYHTNETRELSEEELVKQVGIYLPDSLKGDFTARQLIREIENSSGILRHKTAETYEFIHLTFQEYLTADYISDNRNEEIPKLMENLSDSRWREVTLLLAGIMRNATPLVSQILDYCQRTDDESESHACLLIAFVCLYEAEVADDVQDEVLGKFADLPYEQAVDVIQNTFGLIEEMSMELETLIVNVLKSSNEAVQAWGLTLLERHPSIYERERITQVLSLKSITEVCWRILIADHQENSFDYLNKTYTLCIDSVLDVEDHQKRLLAQSAQLIRSLSGRKALQSVPLVSSPFTPDRGKLPDLFTFADDFAKAWRGTIQWFIDICRALFWSWDQELPRELTEMQAVTRDWVRDRGLARDLARDLDLALARGLDLARDRGLDRALDLALARVRARALTRARPLDLALDRALARALDRDRDRDRALALNLDRALAQDQDRALALNLDLDRDRDLDRALNLARGLNRALDLARDRARGWLLSLTQELNKAQKPERPYIALARDIALALALTNARIQMLDDTQNISFMVNFLQTVGQQDSEHPWYLLTVSQQIDAASFIKPDSTLSVAFGEHWEQAVSPDIAPYKRMFFVNLATLLYSFGIILEGTFFDEALNQSSNPQADFVLRVSFLLYRIITDAATQAERKEFGERLEKSGSEMEREWLELSGLTWLHENILAHSEAEE
ncbi:NACHT domain-containing protein [Candidatus Poribacteria bacterium]